MLLAGEGARGARFPKEDRFRRKTISMLKPLPQIEGYQQRVSHGAARAVLDEGRDVVIQAPTGAGKTPVIARTALELVEAGLHVLVVTHRKELHGQMAGKASGEDEKSRAGEMLWWSGLAPGSIADPSMGGWNQEPKLVVAMIETASRHLDRLKSYDAILVDEAHHLSAESAERPKPGSYSALLEAQEDAKVVALTATPFRGDRDRLHPRLESAHLEVVSHDEALAAKRIVPIRTYIGRAVLENGKTPDDMQKLENDGLMKDAAKSVKKLRGEKFYERVVEDWDRVAKQKPTIMFVDSTKGVADMVRRINKAYGEGTAAGISSKNTKDVNERAVQAYRSGHSKMLVSCLMIGEGFDVPKTNVVVSLFPCLTRTAMNQFTGRGARNDGETEYGLFMDYGTATAKHGPIEVQHRMQNIDALAASKSRIAGAKLLGTVAPVSQNGWSCIPGHEHTLFIHRQNDKYEVHSMHHMAEKESGRKKSQNAGSVSRPRRVQFPGFEGRPVTADVLLPYVAAHVRDEGSYYGRMGGFGTDDYVAKSQDVLNHWIPTLSLLRPPATATISEDEAAKARRQYVEASLRGEDRGGCNSRLVSRALSAGTSGRAITSETIQLSGIALEAYAKTPEMPVGARVQADAIAKEIRREGFDQVSSSQMRLEGQVMQYTMRRMIDEGGETRVTKVLQDLSVPLQAGLLILDKELDSKKKAASR